MIFLWRTLPDRSRLEKILNGFQQIHLRFFQDHGFTSEPGLLRLVKEYNVGQAPRRKRQATTDSMQPSDEARGLLNIRLTGMIHERRREAFDPLPGGAFHVRPPPTDFK
jgi:hypothetical protein